MSRRRLTTVLGVLAALGPLSIDTVLPSFPSLAGSFGASLAAVQLTLPAYLAGIAAGQLIHGPASDRLGRRPPLLAGLGLYVLAAAAGAAAPTLPALVAARFAQGLGACSVIVVSRAVVTDTCSDRDAATLYSSRMVVMGAAPLLAPLLGARLDAAAGWRAVFVALAAAGAALLLLVFRALPETLPRAARSAAGAGAALRGAAAALHDGPFVRLSLAGGLAEAAMFACMAGAPLVFIQRFGVTPERLGLLTGANALGIVVVSQVNRWLVRRLGVRLALRAGAVAAVLAYAALVAAARSGAGLAAFATAMILGVSTIGAVLPNATAAAMDASRQRAGSASAVLGILQTTCGVLASAAVSVLSDGTARPMAGVMLACGALALGLAWRLPAAGARGAASDARSSSGPGHDARHAPAPGTTLDPAA